MKIKESTLFPAERVMPPRLVESSSSGGALFFSVPHQKTGETCPSASRFYRCVALSNNYGLDIIIIISILSDGSTVDTAVSGGRVL